MASSSGRSAPEYKQPENAARARKDPGDRGPAIPVPGSPGNLWREVNDGREDRISRWDTIRRMSGRGSGRACAAAGRWLRGVPGRLQDGRWDDEMQQDSAGLDGT